MINSSNADAAERIGNNIHENCDSDYLCYLDVDTDGHAGTTTGTAMGGNTCLSLGSGLVADDCDDANVGINPDMDEICGNGPSLDEDCSGAPDDKDVDADGWVDNHPLCGGNDCLDSDPTIFPTAPELRDGKDNDCDADGNCCYNDACSCYHGDGGDDY